MSIGRCCSRPSAAPGATRADPCLAAVLPALDHAVARGAAFRRRVRFGVKIIADPRRRGERKETRMKGSPKPHRRVRSLGQNHYS